MTKNYPTKESSGSSASPSSNQPGTSAPDSNNNNLRSSTHTVNMGTSSKGFASHHSGPKATCHNLNPTCSNNLPKANETVTTSSRKAEKPSSERETNPSTTLEQSSSNIPIKPTALCQGTPPASISETRRTASAFKPTPPSQAPKPTASVLAPKPALPPAQKPAPSEAQKPAAPAKKAPPPSADYEGKAIGGSVHLTCAPVRGSGLGVEC